MILLSEIFDNLAFGEFTNLAIGQSVDDSITAAAYPKIVSAVNMGLREIYKRFLLKKKEFNLHQQSGVTIYYLRTDQLGDVGNMDDETYIAEAAVDPFGEDFIRILEAHDELGDVVHINNPKYPDTGIFTQTYDTIKMANHDPLAIITITYQASYPKIIINESFDPALVKLYIPDFIENALYTFIASRLFKGKTGKAAEGENRPVNTYLYQFEAACAKLDELGLAEETEDNYNTFQDRGWQ